jgi:hypothetical protein
MNPHLPFNLPAHLAAITEIVTTTVTVLLASTSTRVPQRVTCLDTKTTDVNCSTILFLDQLATAMERLSHVVQDDKKLLAQHMPEDWATIAELCTIIHNMNAETIVWLRKLQNTEKAMETQAASCHWRYGNHRIELQT